MNSMYFVQDDRDGEDYSLFVAAPSARAAREEWCKFYEIDGSDADVYVHECPSPRRPVGGINWEEINSVLVGKNKETKI